MSRTKRKGWLRSPAIMFVVFVTVLGLSGLVYAFWFTSFTSEGYVNTGNVQMAWGQTGTDDDGWLDNDPSGTDCDDEFLTDSGDPCPVEIWDYHEPWQPPNNPDEFDPGSSADPSSPFAETRYDKDVARCDAGHGEDGESNLVTWINNAYPSYYCTTYATAYNQGSIPVKATGLTMYFEKGYEECAPFFDEAMTDPFDGEFTDSEDGPFVDLNGNGEWDKDEPYEWEMYWQCKFVGTPMEFEVDENGFFTAGLGVGGDGTVEPELNGEIAKGILCGQQIDPGEEGVQTSGWIHVNNAADQNMTYRWTIEQSFVNWNEWDDSMCTFNVGDPN